MTIQPYLFFEGRAEEAANFYVAALGAQIEMLMRNAESPDKPPEGMLPPGSENKVMHMSLKIGDSTIMGSDGRCSGKPEFKGVTLSISASDAADAERIFTALAQGGQVQMPLTTTFFSPKFGMVADKFGVSWMVIVPA